MAVNNMLEVVPAGTHKWVGMAALLDAMQLDASQVPPPLPPTPQTHIIGAHAHTHKVCGNAAAPEGCLLVSSLWPKDVPPAFLAAPPDCVGNGFAGLRTFKERWHRWWCGRQVMTVGDGSNDLQLVGNAGIGVAMGNAVDPVGPHLKLQQHHRPARGTP